MTALRRTRFAAGVRIPIQADRFSALTGIVRFVRCEGVHDAGQPLAMTSSRLFQRGDVNGFQLKFRDSLTEMDSRFRRNDGQRKSNVPR